jgi:S1-C subfamily serine protease
LAVKLARIFGGTGSTSALASIAATGPTAGGNAAQRALGDLLQYLKNRVVTLHADKRVATGFIMSGSSLIVTTAHAIDGIPIDDLKAKLPNGQLQTVGTVVVNQDHDLALLFVRSYESFSAIEFNGLPPEIGEPVMALVIRQEDDELVVAVGSVFMVHATVKISFGDRDRWVENRIAVSIRASPGDSGAPVLDRQGRLIGIVEAGDEKYTFLIPLSEINSLMSKVNEI